MVMNSLTLPSFYSNFSILSLVIYFLDNALHFCHGNLTTSWCHHSSVTSLLANFCHGNRTTSWCHHSSVTSLLANFDDEIESTSVGRPWLR